MAFFASRSNGQDRELGPRGLGPSPPAPPLPAAEDISGLPPWIESAVKKLLASVLPQFKPLVDKTELVLADAQTTLAALRAEQSSLRASHVELAAQIAALKASVDRLALLSVDPD
jgi:hypothetical protein